MRNEDVINQYRKTILEQWTHEVVVAAYVKWHDRIAHHQERLIARLVEDARLSPGQSVLDLGSGTGAHALRMAREIGPQGTVTAADLSAGMVAAIQAHARQDGIENLETVVADSQHLPFDDERFDVVTSMLAPMYFLDTQRSFAEIRRVLRPHGRTVLIAWGMPEEGNYFGTSVLPFLLRSNLEAPPPDAPSTFRFAPPGSLQNELNKARFGNVREERSLVQLDWPGTPEELWRHLYETCIGLRPIFDSLPRRKFEEAYSESIVALRKLYHGGIVSNTVEIVVGLGEKLP